MKRVLMISTVLIFACGSLFTQTESAGTVIFRLQWLIEA